MDNRFDNVHSFHDLFFEILRGEMKKLDQKKDKKTFESELMKDERKI